MAEQLINQYLTPTFVASLGDHMQSVYPSWDHHQFKKDLYDDEWETRALKQRMNHVSVCLKKNLPFSYLETLEVLKKVCIHFTSLEGMVFSDFVEQFGQDNLEASLEALALFTQHGSGEFAIRPFIINHETQVMTRMLAWSKHENVHVRRLASEGCRPRLPWAMALPRFKEDPALVLQILDNLKDDPEEYVRKSVANNLNDITKDNPDLVLDKLEEWSKSTSKRTQWIMKHALRGLVKAGHPRALKLLGFEDAKIKLSAFQIVTPTVAFGDSLEFSFQLKNLSKTSGQFVVDYLIYFVKANGSQAPKVFKIKNLELGPNKVESITKSHAIKPITIRKYYPGKHRVAIQVNGKILAEKSFKLLMTTNE